VESSLAYESQVTTLSDLVSQTVADPGASEHVFFVLPSASDKVDGLTAVAPKLGKVKGIFSDMKKAENSGEEEARSSPAFFTEKVVKSALNGGVNPTRLSDALQKVGVDAEIVDGLEAFLTRDLEPGKSFIVNVARGDSHGNLDDVLSGLMRGDTEAKGGRTVVVASEATVSDKVEARAARRKLADDNANANNGEDIYYVNMTPNILSGLLFGFLFIFVTIIGMSCMNAIEGQTIFVSKMPSIGREC